MRIFLRILAYALAIPTLMLAISMAMTGNWWQAFPVFMAAVFIAPVTGRRFARWFGRPTGKILRLLSVAFCLGAFAVLAALQKTDSIYSSPEIRDRFHRLYAAELADWPVNFETHLVPTSLGPVNVIVSGPPNGPPMVLLHASGVASWSWKHNIAGLSGPYRTYAIDLIGDAGLSEYQTLDNVMRGAVDQARLYSGIMNAFGISKAVVVGASEGGFIASNLALHAPERVKRLILLGPMGYSGATQAILRITIAQMFPFSALRDSTFRWAFSDSTSLRDDYSEWFGLLMEKTFPRKVAPFPISAAERQSLTMPVLFIFGERDNLVGDPETATALVQDIPDVTVRTVPAGHLMAAELPEAVNELILNFASGELPR